MDFELTEEQRAFAQTARDFALAELAPHAAEWGRRRHLPQRRHRQGGRTGLLRPVCARSRRRPRPAPAWMPRWCLKKWRRLTPAPPPSSPSTTWPPGCWAPGPARRARPPGPLLTTGQTRQLLPDRARRGSDAASLKTRAELVGNEYVINGSKGLHQRRRQHRCAGAHGAIRTGDAHPAPAVSAPLRARRHARHHLRQKNTRWAGTASPPAPSALTTCASPPTTCWGKKAKARSP